MNPIAIHPLILCAVVGVVLLGLGALIGHRIPSRAAGGTTSPRLTFTPVRITAVVFASFMLAAFLVATIVAIDFLRAGLALLSNPATQSEGVNQIMLAVVAQNALYVLLSNLAGPLGELCKQSNDSP